MAEVFDLESLVHVEQKYTLLISLQKCNNRHWHWLWSLVSMIQDIKMVLHMDEYMDW